MHRFHFECNSFEEFMLFIAFVRNMNLDERDLTELIARFGTLMEVNHVSDSGASAGIKDPREARRVPPVEQIAHD